MKSKTTLRVSLEEIDELDSLQAKQNDGRGVCCVQDIVMYLRIGRWQDALAVRQNDGDKTRGYPILEEKLRSIFGCRLHADKKCKVDLCRDLYRTCLDRIVGA